MTGRRKGTPCACEADPCSCGSSKGKCVRAVNNVSPDPNGDLIIRGGTGIEVIQSGDDLVINNTANPNAFVAGNNIELNPSGDDISIDLVDEPVVDGLTVNGDTQLNGDLEVNGDIIQNGSAYETHAEKIYTRDDYIIMRDGAIAALAPGDYAGFQVKLYDGVNDGRLVIDSSGTARVGDVGDEAPLLTRDEAADLTDGDSLIWNAANSKAITAAIPSAISTALSNKMSKNITGIVLSPSSPSGLSVNNYNSYNGACVVRTIDDKIVLVDICVTVNGTYSGSTGWKSLFSNQSDIPTGIMPYRTVIGSYTFNSNLEVYLTNGQTYNQDITMRFIGFKS